MSGNPQPAIPPRGLARRMLPLAVIVILGVMGYFAVGIGGISLESLVHHRDAIDTFVIEHRVLAVFGYIGLYIVMAALSLPGAAFLTVAGGFLFGIAVGASAAVLGATAGATLIFLLARTAFGETLLLPLGSGVHERAKRSLED